MAEPSVKTCPSCGTILQQNSLFCTQCGNKISESEHPHWMFVNTFFKLGEISKYVSRYFSTLTSPTRKTIEYFETETIGEALKFLEFSAGIYVLLAFSKILFVEDQDLLSGILTSLALVVTWSVCFVILYYLSRGSNTQRSYNNFVEFMALYLGLTLPVIAVVTWIQLSVDFAAGTAIQLVVAIPLMIFTVRAWKYFWGFSTWGVLWRLFVSSVVAGMVSIGIVFGIMALTGNSLAGKKSNIYESYAPETPAPVIDIQSYDWQKNTLGNTTTMQVDVPGTTQDISSEVAERLNGIATTVDYRNCTIGNEDVVIQLGYYEFIVDGDLEGGIEGMVNSIRGNPDASDFEYKKLTIEIDGVAGRKVMGAFKLNGVPVRVSSYMFVDGHDAWMITIIYKDENHPRALVNKMEESIAFSR